MGPEKQCRAVYLSSWAGMTNLCPLAEYILLHHMTRVTVSCCVSILLSRHDEPVSSGRIYSAPTRDQRNSVVLRIYPPKLAWLTCILWQNIFCSFLWLEKQCCALSKQAWLTCILWQNIFCSITWPEKQCCAAYLSSWAGLQKWRSSQNHSLNYLFKAIFSQKRTVSLSAPPPKKKSSCLHKFSGYIKIKIGMK